MANHSAKVTSKGQVTIPKAIREQLELQEGDWLIFEPKDRSVEVHKGRLMGDTAFDQFASDVEKRFKEQGITHEDVEDAIQWARKQS